MPHKRSKKRPAQDRPRSPCPLPAHSASDPDAFFASGCNYALHATNGLYRPPRALDLPIMESAVARLDSFLLAVPPLRRQALLVAWDMRGLHLALSRYRTTLLKHRGPPFTHLSSTPPAPPPSSTPVASGPIGLPGDAADPIRAYCLRLGFRTPSSDSLPSSGSPSLSPSLSEDDLVGIVPP